MIQPVGVQFITMRQLAQDVRLWATMLPENIRAFVGLPRSGLTVAHLLSAHRNLPAMQLHAPPFRQRTGRAQQSVDGPFLVVDDACSYGTAINDARQEIRGALFGAVYARATGRKACALEHWYRRHGDLNRLVLCEWNWCHHQDSEHVAVEDTAIMRDGYMIERPSRPLHSILGNAERINHWIKRGRVPAPKHGAIACRSQGELADLYAESAASLLAVRRGAEEIARHANKPVLDAATMTLHDPTPQRWPEKIFNIGLPRTGTATFCRAMDAIGWKAQHCPTSHHEIERVEAAADVFVAHNYKTLDARYPGARWVMTVRNSAPWLESMGRWQKSQQGRTSREFVRRHPGLAEAVGVISEPLEDCYREYTAAAEKHFGRRLLRWDVTDGWEPLCRFLDEPIPDEPLPHANSGGFDECRYSN